MKKRLVRTRNKKSQNYIDKEQFYEEMVKYSKSKKKVISNYIGECFLNICNKLALSYNFRSYSYIDEMVSDGIENCIKAVDSFDIKKSKNPFAYFTEIAYWAFVRRIQAEKKQQYIKHKNMQVYLLHGKIDKFEESELSDNVIEDFERKIKEKKEKLKQG